MPTGIRQLGMRGERFELSSIFAVVSLCGRLIVRHHVARHEVKPILLGSLLPIAGSPSCVHHRDDFCSVPADPINHGVWKSPQPDLADAWFHLSIDRRLECKAFERFAEMVYESAGDFRVVVFGRRRLRHLPRRQLRDARQTPSVVLRTKVSDDLLPLGK